MHLFYLSHFYQKYKIKVTAFATFTSLYFYPVFFSTSRLVSKTIFISQDVQDIFFQFNIVINDCKFKQQGNTITILIGLENVHFQGYRESL